MRTGINRIGQAGEHLVCYRLLSFGVRSHIIPVDLYPYDILSEVGDMSLRIQVKSCSKPNARTKKSRSLYYQFHNQKGKGPQRKYRESAYDILALVAMDIGKILFMPKPKKMTIRIAQDRFLDTSEKLSWDMSVSEILPQKMPGWCPDRGCDKNNDTP